MQIDSLPEPSVRSETVNAGRGDLTDKLVAKPVAVYEFVDRHKRNQPTLLSRCGCSVCAESSCNNRKRDEYSENNRFAIRHSNLKVLRGSHLKIENTGDWTRVIKRPVLSPFMNNVAVQTEWWLDCSLIFVCVTTALGAVAETACRSLPNAR